MLVEVRMREDQVRGGLIGLLVGDALGVPYEFHVPANLPPRGLIEMTPPPGFRRSHRGVPPGTWSDDGSQALCLLASLLDHGGLDLADFSGRLVAWYRDGLFTPDGRAFDIGNQTSAAFDALEAGVPPERAGPRGERDNGNGSLMRVLPLALWHRGDDAELARLAAAQSLPTHGHPRSQACCAVACLWARRLARGDTSAWDGAVAAAARHLAPAARAELDLIADVRPPGGSGYVVDTLWGAHHALQAGGYEDVVRAAIALGLDTDTTACVAGGLCGVRDGVEAIPARWRDALRGMHLVEPLLRALA